MGFDFSATAQCELCGNYLNSSDEECSQHSAEDVSLHFFRRLCSDKLTAVRATRDYCWQRLADSKEGDWIAWIYLGDRSLISKYIVDYDISEIPHKQMSHEVTDVEYNEE